MNYIVCVSLLVIDAYRRTMGRNVTKGRFYKRPQKSVNTKITLGFPGFKKLEWFYLIFRGLVM